MSNIKGSIGFKPIIAVLLMGAGFFGIAYYFSVQFSELSSRLSVVSSRLESASRERDLLGQGVKAAMDSSRLLETDLGSTDEKFSESLQSALSQEEKMIEKNREFLERLNTSLTDLAISVQEEKIEREEAAGEVLKQLESFREQIEISQGKLSGLSEELNGFEREIDERFKRHSQKESEALASISEGQEELKDQVRQIAENLRSEMSLLETEMERIDARMDNLKREIVRLESRRPE